MIPIFWLESLEDCALRTYGLCDIAFGHLIHEVAEVPNEIDDLWLPDEAYGELGSVVNKLSKRINCTWSIFKMDNGMIYSMLEEATRCMTYATIVKPYSRIKDGWQTWLEVLSSHVSNDKWENIWKEKMNFLMNLKWLG